MTYIPDCEDPVARKEIRLHNELVEKQWDIKAVRQFVDRNPIPGVDAQRLAHAVQSIAHSLGRISECCVVCGSTEVTLHAHYAGRFCKAHFEEGMKREEALDRITCGNCGDEFKHDDLEHGLCGTCTYAFNN